MGHDLITSIHGLVGWWGELGDWPGWRGGGGDAQCADTQKKSATSRLLQLITTNHNHPRTDGAAGGSWLSTGGPQDHLLKAWWSPDHQLLPETTNSREAELARRRSTSAKPEKNMLKLENQAPPTASQTPTGMNLVSKGWTQKL